MEHLLKCIKKTLLDLNNFIYLFLKFEDKKNQNFEHRQILI